MRPTLLAVALALALATPLAARESFVYHARGVTVTNGLPVNVKTIKARYSAPFFWFTRGNREYLVTDAKALARVHALYAPLFAQEDQLLWAGEQRKIVAEQRKLAQEKDSAENRRRQNELAMRLNELSRLQRLRMPDDVDEINAAIEQKLEALSADFLRERLARAR